MSQSSYEEMTMESQKMETCCELLQVIPSSQVHKDIVRAILQVTTYHKKYVNGKGAIDPRDLSSGRSKFGSKFLKEVVDHFLIDLRGGILFFPIILPDYSGWKDSFATSRLIWKNGDQEAIRAGMALLIENIRSVPVSKEFLKDTEVYQSFTSIDCDDCGGGKSSPTDNIVYCTICKVGYHQSCYSLEFVPPGPWYCKPCADSKVKATASSTRKRPRLSSDKDIKESTAPSRRAASVANVDLQNAKGQLKALVSPFSVSSDSRKAPIGKLSSISTALTQSDRSLNDSRDETRRLNSIIQKFITPNQLENTILVTRLASQNLGRFVHLSQCPNVQLMLSKCRLRWPEKFGKSPVARILACFEVLGNCYMEIVPNIESDWEDFMRIIGMEWKSRSNLNERQVLYIQVVLLAAGEAAPDL